MTGTLFSVGVGPGDPELITMKAARILRAAPVYAFFAKHGRPGHARLTAAAHLAPDAVELRFEYPYTTEVSHQDAAYAKGMTAFYEAAAAAIATHLEAGSDVALLCEGDPFFYGSAMYVFDRLAGYPHETIPGVTGMSGCWSRAGLPMTHGDDVLTVVPGTLDEAALVARLVGTDAAVVMKLGRNMPKICRALEQAGRLHEAVYVERGTMVDERIVPIGSLPDTAAPYFAIILVPGRHRPR